ncbi:MAG: protein TolR [Rhodospirillaceae bacterium]|jgi:biopolymer transport protein TolR
MAIEFNQGPRRGGRRSYRPMSEINVTPFVDVMLVLLIIFMVTAPLLTVGVQVDLPKTSAKSIAGKDEPLTVSVNKDGQIYLQETEIQIDALAPRLQAITGSNPNARIFVRGDRDINYGLVMEVMGTINAAGYKKVALITSQKHRSLKQRKKK